MGGSGGRWVLRSVGIYHIAVAIYSGCVGVVYIGRVLAIQKLEIRIWLLCHATTHTELRYDMKNKYKRCAGIVMIEYTQIEDLCECFCDSEF